jgi:hypothetical protein
LEAVQEGNSESEIKMEKIRERLSEVQDRVIEEKRLYEVER